MSKIPVWMDLISGLLLAAGALIPKRSMLGKADSRLRKIINNLDTSRVTDPKTMIFNLLGAVFAFLSLLLWTWYKNAAKGGSVWPEIGLFGVGIIAGATVINAVAILFRRVFVGNLGFATFVGGLGLSMLSLIIGVRLSKSPSFVSALIAFVYMCILLPFTTLIANRVRTILLDRNDPFYMFALLGAAIFIVGKVIELTG